MTLQNINVLIIDDSSHTRSRYKEILFNVPEIQYEFLEANTGEEGLAYCKTQQIDCILLDYALEDLNGLEFLKKFSKDRAEDKKFIPIILLTNHGNELIAIEALRRGVQDYLIKEETNDHALRFAVARCLSKATVKQKKPIEHLSLIDELSEQIKNSLLIFEIENGQFIEANEGACKSLEANKEEILSTSLYDLVQFEPGIHDWKQNIESITQTKKETTFKTQYRRRDGRLLPIEVSLKIVKEKNREYIIAIARDIVVQNALDEAFQKSTELNEITGLYNPRFFSNLLSKEWRRALRMQYALALLCIEIDYFENFEKKQGEKDANLRLQEIASCLHNQIKRAGDEIAHTHKSGLAIILPNTNLQQAHALASIMEEKVRYLKIKNPQSPIGNFFTLSIGIISTIPNDSLTEEIFLNQATLALESAKQAGGDQIKTFTQNPL